jgi:hypothetical protein
MNLEIRGRTVFIETDALTAQVKTEGYVSGVASGTLVDKKTGAHDLGHGLDIVDFLLEAGHDDDSWPAEHRYQQNAAVHGENLPKRYVELPQICTQARKLPFSVTREDDRVEVRQWWRWKTATAGRKPGSLWEQRLVFKPGLRYFLAEDRVTSMNDVESLILRIDLPGHLKHKAGDTFEKIYLSYKGELPAGEFLADFPPDKKFIYQRNVTHPPERFIRAYKIRNGPWLAGMTLAPEIVYEAWCHQRGYVCFIEEIGGYRVRAGGSFSAAYVIGFFDSIGEMERVYDAHRGWKALP